MSYLWGSIRAFTRLPSGTILDVRAIDSGPQFIWADLPRGNFFYELGLFITRTNQLL